MTRLVVFDVDSTLLAEETLDFALARVAPDFAERAAEITAKGMSGAMDLSESLALRLSMAPLTRADISETAEILRERATPGIAELLAALRENGDAVRAVSGGFRPLIGPALGDLGFAPDHIRANEFRFDGDRVAGFDPDIPLSRNGGKNEIVRKLREETGADRAVIVGDGATDLEAYVMGAADDFVGFGAIARRESVEARAPRYAVTVEALRDALLS